MEVVSQSAMLTARNSRRFEGVSNAWGVAFADLASERSRGLPESKTLARATVPVRNSAGFGLGQSFAAFATAAQFIRCGKLPRGSAGWLVILIWLFGLASSIAQLPTPRLLTIFPPGARVGSVCDVTVSGIDLDDGYALIFSNSNIVSQVKSNETSGLAEPNKFIVTVASNVPPATYEVRIAGRFGISNPRRFAVGVLPELQESPNLEIPLGSTVNGHADGQSVDYFRFNAKKGQRILAICDAAALDSRLEPSLFLIDSQERELERSRRGGLLDFEAPVDGQYTIKLHDFLFNGGTEYFYRLHRISDQQLCSSLENKI